MSLRRITLGFAILLVLIWGAAGFFFARHYPDLDVSGLHGIGLFVVVPAFLLAAFGRWVPLAFALACCAAFIYLSVLVASRISN